MKSHLKFFTDDISVFSIVKNPNTSPLDLNHDFGVISKWAYQWKMRFNAHPTTQVVYSHTNLNKLIILE